MEKNLIVLKNALNGLFITHDDKFEACDTKINTRVSVNVANAVLNEFKQARFIKVNGSVEKAETINFVFYKYPEDAGDDITRVELKSKPVLQ